jgi:hypothetical protein
MLISIPPKYSLAEVTGYLQGKNSIWIAQNVNASCGIFLGTNSGRGDTSFRPRAGMRRYFAPISETRDGGQAIASVAARGRLLLAVNGEDSALFRRNGFLMT